MHSTFDERNWLVWLVKVRILILTLLLAMELAVAQFSPGPLPMRLFVSTILFWYCLSLFYVLLLSFWHEHRLQASLQVLTDLIMVSLVIHETGGWDSSLNFLYPLVIIVASVLLPRSLGAARRRSRFHSLRHGAGTELLRRCSFLLHHPPRIEGAAVDHFRQPVRLPRGRLPGRPAHHETAAGGRTAERHQRSARKPAGPARKHYSLDQQRPDHHRPRRPYHAGQRRSAKIARAAAPAIFWGGPRRNCFSTRCPAWNRNILMPKFASILRVSSARPSACAWRR